MNTHNSDDDKIVYWHRELPPLTELMAEHTLEATSSRVPGTISHRDELWDRCYRELMSNTQIHWCRRSLAAGAITRTFTMNPSTSAMTTRPAKRGYTDAFLTCCTVAPRCHPRDHPCQT